MVPSSNGRTPVFHTGNMGSSPIGFIFFFRFFRLAELVDAVSSKLIYCWFESSNEHLCVVFVGYRLIGRTAVFGTANVGSSPPTPILAPGGVV